VAARESSSSRTLMDALRDNPEWRRLYFARTISLVGNWLNTLAIVHLLGSGEHSSALALALVFVLKQVPVTVFGPAAGVVADRYQRRNIMVVVDVLSATLVLGFLFAHPGGSHVYIYALTLLQIGAVTYFDPAYRATVPDIVREDDLVAANALSAVTWSATFAVGTALGGLVLYLFGWRVAFALDAATYIVSALLIRSLRAPGPAPRARGISVGLMGLLGIDEMIAGVRYVLRTPAVRSIIVVKFIWGIMGALTLFLTLLGAQPGYRIFGSGDMGISFLWFCRAIGTGAGPPIARHFARGDERRLRLSIAIGFAIAIAFYAVIPLMPTFWLAGLSVGVAHVGGSMVWVMSTVLLQQRVPSEYRGRTFAAELGLVMLASSASHLVYATLLDHTALTLTGAIPLAAGVCAIFAAFWVVRVALPETPVMASAAGV